MCVNCIHCASNYWQHLSHTKLKPIILLSNLGAKTDGTSYTGYFLYLTAWSVSLVHALTEVLNLIWYQISWPSVMSGF